MDLKLQPRAMQDNSNKDSSQPEKAENASTQSAETEDAQPKMSREEQLAQFEEALKEEDWGHQPCWELIFNL